MVRRPRIRFMALCTALALVGACQPGASPSPSPATAPPSSAPSSAAPSSPEASAGASPSAAAGGGSTLEVVATEYAFQTAASVPAGPVTITLINDGQEEHQAQIARIAEGSTMQDVIAALQQPDPTAAFSLLTFVGGPTGIPPGGEQDVSAVLEPGMHVLLCFVPAPDGVPHLAKGMVAQLEVTEGTTGQLPAGDAELTLQDFSFVGLDSLPAGEQVVHVSNNGPQPHEATVVRLTEGVTVPDIIGMLSASPAPDGPPPWTPAGGVAAMANGLDATMTLDLEPGNYALVCFVPDPATGKAHVELGMIGALTVE